MNPITRLVSHIMYRHERIEKPGVGALHIFTNRITRRITDVIVWPEDIRPPIEITEHPHIAALLLNVAVNPAMLRTQAELIAVLPHLATRTTN